MMDLTALSVVEAEVAFTCHRLDSPLLLSSGSIDSLVEATATVRVAIGTATAVGRGSICLSDLWSWPGGDPDRDQKVAIMTDYCQQVAKGLPDFVGDVAHPLELGLRLHDAIAGDHDHPAPVLARSVCASPFDAAIHDAAGRLIGASAFDLYRADAEVPSADHFYPEGAVRAVREALVEPRADLPGWWLVGMNDDLAEVGRRVAPTGIDRFKLKLSGVDPVADAHRTAEIHRAACEWVARPRLSVDTNEASRDPAAVLTYLAELDRIDAMAYRAVDYLEQPTARGTLADFELREVADRKPVLLDEGFTGLDDLRTAHALGWDGLALKTCKGHSVALAAAAWARRHGMTLAMQDLTNIGLAAIHSYLVAAHLDPINGIELNSPQYLPEANADWLPRLSGLFQVRDGRHRLNPAGVIGLGSGL